MKPFQELIHKTAMYFLDVEFEYDTFGEVIITNGVLQHVGLTSNTFFCKKGAKINEVWGSYENVASDYGVFREDCKFFPNGTWSLVRDEYHYDSMEGTTSTTTVLYSGTYTIVKNEEYDISMDIDEEFKTFVPEGYDVKYYADYENDVIVLYSGYYFAGKDGLFNEVGKYAKYPWEYNEDY